MSHFILPHDAEFTEFPLSEERIPDNWKWLISSHHTSNEIQTSLESLYSTIQNDTVRTFAAGLLKVVKVYGFAEAFSAIGLVRTRSSPAYRFLLLKPPISLDASIIDRFASDSYRSLILFFVGMTDISSSGDAAFVSYVQKIDFGGVLGFNLFRLPTGDMLFYVPSTGAVWQQCDEVVSKHSNSLEECLEWYLSTFK